MIYAISDIHGCIYELKQKMSRVELSGKNRIVFLGDYIDYGEYSFQVLQYLYELQQRYGSDKVIVLKGNHEAMFLDWINEYRNPYASETGELMIFNDWLRTEMEYGSKTVRTFISEQQYRFLEKIARTSSFETINREAADMILSGHGDLIFWIECLPDNYETDKQIFVHAGVDEEAGEYWKWGTSDELFLWKFPPSAGRFYKTVIAGHVGTGAKELADDDEYHEVFYDGESHYYIDGGVYKKDGKLLLLAYDEAEEMYYSIQDNGRKIRAGKDMVE